MKKTLFALAALVAILTCASCSKTCNCKVTGSVGGNTASADKTITLKDGEKCSDHNSNVTIGGVSAGLKCTPQLF